MVDPIRKTVYVVAVGSSSKTFTQMDSIKIWSLDGKEDEIRKWEERRARLKKEEDERTGAVEMSM